MERPAENPSPKSHAPKPVVIGSWLLTAGIFLWAGFYVSLAFWNQPLFEKEFMRCIRTNQYIKFKLLVFLADLPDNKFERMMLMRGAIERNEMQIVKTILSKCDEEERKMISILLYLSESERKKKLAAKHERLELLRSPWSAP